MSLHGRLLRRVVLAGVVGITFVTFMVADPEPSLLLSACVAINAGLVLWAIYEFYKRDLLLSPLSALLCSGFSFLRYSWGNLGPRMAGAFRFISNPGSENFYPLAALLSTVGLSVFLFGGLRFLRHPDPKRIKYQDLTWQPWQVVASASVTTVVLVYLSSRYELVNGYFAAVGVVDRILANSYFALVLLTMLMGVSVTLKVRSLQGRVLGPAGVVFATAVALGMRSRMFMMLAIIFGAACWVTIRPRHLRGVSVAATGVGLVVFMLGTVVKVANNTDRNHINSLLGNLAVVRSLTTEKMTETNVESGRIDWTYRLAGFELPAAILNSLDLGAPPMYGRGAAGGIVSSLPNFIRPEGDYSERLEIARHYIGHGMNYADSPGIPLSSGLADWGVVGGPLIYIVMGLYYVLMWKFVQRDPRWYLAYLSVWCGGSEQDLFWEGGLFLIRAIGFAWLFLVVTGPMLMPTVAAGDQEMGRWRAKWIGAVIRTHGWRAFAGRPGRRPAAGRLPGASRGRQTV